MLGIFIHLRRIGGLHQLAQIHDAHPVGDVLDHGQVVGDEEIGQAQLILELDQQIDDLCLDGHVQGGDGLVADDELGIDGQRAGDADALTLAAGKFVGEAVGVLPVQAHQLQAVIDHFLPLRALIQVVDVHALADDIAHGHAGVQGGVGVLEDHLGFPGKGLLFGPVELGDVAAVEQDGAGGRLVELDQSAADGGFAAAGFAHQAQSAAPGDVEADSVHRLEHVFAGGEVFFQIFHLQQRFRHGQTSRKAAGDRRGR